MSKINQRDAFKVSKRIVVKIGSALLAHSEEGILRDRIAAYCAQISNLANDGYKVVVVTSGTKEAEMVKLLENTYRQVNIALINELAILCNMLDLSLIHI